MAKPPKTNDYAAALDLLDAQLASGRISQNQHTVDRAVLLAEAVAQPLDPLLRRVLTIVEVVLVLGLVVLVLGVLGGALSGP